MAVTMADSMNRKACDRCHTQKLSCKRVGDEACERCIRLGTQCKSSPSLRFRKHRQQRPATGEVVRRSIPAPIRQRAGDRSQAVQPDLSFVKAQHQQGDVIGGAGCFGGNDVVSPDSILDMVNFDFSFDHSGIYQSNSDPIDEHQLPQPFTNAVDGLLPEQPVSHVSQDWSPQNSTTSGSVLTSPIPADPDSSGRGYIGGPQPQRHSDKPGQPPDGGKATQLGPRKRAKRKTQQIALQPAVRGRDASSDAWMPRIIDINSRLLQLSSCLPQQAEQAEPWEEQPSRFSMVSSSTESSSMLTTPFSIDDMFKLSRHFAETLAEVAPIEGASPASDDESCQPARGLDSCADPATCLFVLSTYVRLLDMYQKVFSCIHSQLAHLQPGNLFQSWRLPGVTVGSFAVDSTPSLQMSLTIQLAEEFLSQMRRAASSLDPTQRSGGSPVGKTPDAASIFSGVVDVSFQALKRQEESLGRELKGLRKDMEVYLDG